MVGANVPVPIPAGSSFGGWKDSLFGDSCSGGPDRIHFFTRDKVVCADAGVVMRSPIGTIASAGILWVSL